MIAAVTVAFLFCQRVFLKLRAKTMTSSGAKILAELNVYIDNTKEIADIVRYHHFSFTPMRNNQAPVTIKKVATFASKAARDKLICQGDIASSKLVSKAY